MPRNVTDMNKLKQSIEFMSKASKTYNDKKRKLIEKQKATEIEPQSTNSSFSNTNGATQPFG